MASCNDCYFFEKYMCTSSCISTEPCEHFKDKNLIVELPCKVGDTVYMTMVLNNVWEIIEGEVYNICFEKNSTSVLIDFENGGMFRNILISKIGETFYLTKAEAEQKVKEMTKNG